MGFLIREKCQIYILSQTLLWLRRWAGYKLINKIYTCIHFLKYCSKWIFWIILSINLALMFGITLVYTFYYKLTNIFKTSIQHCKGPVRLGILHSTNSPDLPYLWYLAAVPQTVAGCSLDQSHSLQYIFQSVFAHKHGLRLETDRDALVPH